MFFIHLAAASQIKMAPTHFAPSFFLLCALIALMQYLAKIFCQGTKVIPIQKCPMRTQQFASTQIKQT
jgi:hypothetical protein